jgi:hypothetical protein
MLEVLRECIQDGLMFPELWKLHDQIVRYFVTLAKIHTLLKVRPENLDEATERNFVFTAAECDHIISIAVYHDELKALKSKETAENILQEIRGTAFPRYLE